MKNIWAKEKEKYMGEKGYILQMGRKNILKTIQEGLYVRYSKIYKVYQTKPGSGGYVDLRGVTINSLTGQKSNTTAWFQTQL